MISNRWLAAAYFLAVLASSSVSATFEWASPIDTPEGPYDYYTEVGLRNGTLVAGGHDPPGGGWMLDVGWPRFMPLPVYAGAGPESGGACVATWFLIGAVAVVHFLIGRRRRPA